MRFESNLGRSFWSALFETLHQDRLGILLIINNIMLFNIYTICLFENDIGTEELAHLEMIGTICYQLTKDVDVETIKKCGYSAEYVEHGLGIYPSNAMGAPFNAASLQSKGDVVTDLMEDLAAEQKAKQTYEYLINLTDDPDVLDPLRFLREREVVHFQRFGEVLRLVQDKQNEKKFYMNNPM